ncbi:MAG TPA: aminotransferase class I/II-fold pyridoxal phosphate-dependent enzyme [Candidatus Rifleibacterium sp.]|nr:aminotransferase class I/II-fold pyridoxal phosphate-dependent enzyme [Candidatus Rifleibacterium sp.]HPT44948.1 aminotransferase class I/II-fold pyridoxal phosphate-dependent enzyme [Candidatus Rifleibacterium sp.]
MNLFRTDLLKAGPPADISVPRKKNMMCLNESVLDPYQAIDEAFHQTMQHITLNRYFSGVTNELKQSLVEYVGHGLAGDNLLWGNGADDMLYAAFLAVRENDAAFALSLAPSYFDYSTYAQAVGLGIKFMDFRPDFSFDEREYVKILNSDNCRLGILCNPNNPTGHLISDEQILYVLNNTQKLVLLDETYFEFSGITWASRIKDFSHLLIVRSFSKSFSAAGLRFGYVLSQPQNITELRKVQTIFNTSIMVQAFVMTMLMNRELFLRHTRAAVALKHELFKQMQEIDGLKVYPTHTNFVTFSAGARSAALFEHLKNNEIAIRDVGAHPLLKNCLRVSVGSLEQNCFFIDQVRAFLAG